MTVILHDMLHVCNKDYVDDIIVKSRKISQHIDNLRKVFLRCRCYSLRMNPLKCPFGFSSGKFLGFIVHQKGNDFDPPKAKAIQYMKPRKLNC